MRQTHTNRGFTLIETLVTVLLFALVMMITGRIFETALPKTKTIARSEASNIEGMIGLEMFRRDLEQAGFGLFTDVDSLGPAYNEAASAPESGFNDAPGGVPRAVVAADQSSPASGSLAGTDYLVLKATTVALNPTSQCWTSIRGYDAAKVWGSGDLQEGRGDHVVVVSQTYKSGDLQRRLIYDTGAAEPNTAAFRADGSYAAPFAPNSNDKQYYYYGIDSIVPRAPFNRTDYIVKRVTAETPARCAPAAGVLYKRVLNQADGSMQEVPIVDCVADMQVVFGWNTGADPGSNAADTYTNADGSSPGGLSTADQPLTDAKTIRNRLKLIKVYLLVQDGGLDRNYANTSTAMLVGEAGETGFTKSIDLTQPNYRNYRWRLYRLVVRPKNLS